jgi:hypothetical protein
MGEWRRDIMVEAPGLPVASVGAPSQVAPHGPASGVVGTVAGIGPATGSTGPSGAPRRSRAGPQVPRGDGRKSDPAALPIFPDIRTKDYEQGLKPMERAGTGLYLVWCLGPAGPTQGLFPRVPPLACCARWR